MNGRTQGGLSILILSSLLLASLPTGAVEPEATSVPMDAIHERLLWTGGQVDSALQAAYDLGDGDTVIVPGIVPPGFTQETRDLFVSWLGETWTDAFFLVVAAQQADDPEALANLISDVSHILKAPAIAEGVPEDTCLVDDNMDLSKYPICFGTRGKDTYTRSGNNFGTEGTIFIDWGGDDEYQSGARSFGSHGIFLDLGGNDTYFAHYNSFGYGNTKIQTDADSDYTPLNGLFLDTQGDDEYIAAASNSFGSYAGAFLDLAGDDRYTDRDGEYSFGVQRGLFYEETGRDSYEAGRYSFGAYSGWFVEMWGWDTYKEYPQDYISYAFGYSDGTFIDRHGDDSYQVRSYSFGWLGSFIDLRGDDTYHSNFESFASGTDGIFIDGDGDDMYEIARPPIGTPTRSNSYSGFGVNSGTFADLAGNDDYKSSHGGFGQDGGTFLDARGNDRYQAKDFAFGSYLNAAFFDLEGDDVYTGNDEVFGAGMAFFVDGAGDDVYTANSMCYGYGRTDINDITGSLKAFTAAPGLPPMPAAAYAASYGFHDIGGSDTYTAAATSHKCWGSYNNALFHDSADPLGLGPASNNGVLRVGGGEPVSQHDVASPLPDLFQGLDGQYKVTVLEQPLVVKSGEPATLKVRVEATEPTTLEAFDDLGVPLGEDEGRTMVSAGGEVIELDYHAKTEGQRTIRFEVADVASLHGRDRTYTAPIIFDGTPPALELGLRDGAKTLLARDHHSSTSAEFTATVEDLLSGMEAVYIKVGSPPQVGVDTPTWEPSIKPFQTSKTLSLPITDDDIQQGSNDIHVLALDAAGHQVRASLTWLVDRTAPDASVAISGGTIGDDGWYTTAPTVTVTWTDAHSGPGDMDYQWTGATQKVGSGTGGSKDVTPIFQAGTSRLSYEVYDMAVPALKTTAVDALTLKVDEILPTSQSAPFSSSPAPLQIGLTGADEGSGLSHVEWRAYLPNQAPPAWQTGTDIELHLAGDWTVQHRAVDKAGNVGDTTTLQATVLPNPPVAAFTTPDGPFLSLEDVAFHDASTDDDGGLKSWSWDFGDGATSQDQHPVHAYAKPGTYTVELTVTDIHDMATTIQRDIVIQNRAPTSKIIGPAEAWTGQTRTFASAATDMDGQILTTTWSLDGQNVATGETADITFPTAGTYSLALKVLDDKGAADTATIQVLVTDKPDILADLTWDPITPAVYEDVRLIDLSDAGLGKFVERHWRVDGVPVTGIAPTIQFETPGEHMISLQVVHEDGRVRDISKTIHVEGLLPLVDFSSSGDMRSFDTIAFTDLTSHPDPARAIVAWSWDFGGSGSSTQADPHHTFQDKGTYAVKLTVTDDFGIHASKTRLVQIANRPAEITVPDIPTQKTGQPITITPTVEDLDGEIVSMRWKVGTTGSTGPAWTGTFVDPGTYTVELEVLDDDGGISTATIPIDVEGIPPVADFTWDPPAPMSGDEVFLVDTSSDDAGIDTWAWTIGEQTFDGAVFPHHFAKPGAHEVTLTVTDTHGLQATISKTIQIGDRPPIAAFDIDQASALTGQALTFTDASTDDGGVTSWQWDFGDGMSGSGATVGHTYTKPGTYDVTLTVADASKSVATQTLAIEIENRLPVIPAMSPVFAQEGEAAVFTVAPVDPEGETLTIQWAFADGARLEGSSVEHLLAPGNHTVTVTVSDPHGSVTADVTARVFPAPPAPVQEEEEPVAETNETEDVEQEETLDDVSNKESPGLGLWALLVALAAFATRRR